LPNTLLSEMSARELESELQRCQEGGLSAASKGLTSEYKVWEQRYYLTRSYLLDPDSIMLGATYGLADSTALFIAKRLHGILAYGNVLGEQEERGFPIGQLIALDFAHDKNPLASP